MFRRLLLTDVALHPTPNPTSHPAAAPAKALLGLNADKQEVEDGRTSRSVSSLPLLLPNNHTTTRGNDYDLQPKTLAFLTHDVAVCCQLALPPQPKAASFKSKDTAPKLYFQWLF